MVKIAYCWQGLFRTANFLFVNKRQLWTSCEVILFFLVYFMLWIAYLTCLLQYLFNTHFYLVIILVDSDGLRVVVVFAILLIKERTN